METFVANSMDDLLCHIEILKDGHYFIARTEVQDGTEKEFKNTVFEDMLTEMVITLQEQMAEVDLPTMASDDE